MKVEVSIGELVDKVTILSIKLEKFSNREKKINVRKEYDILFESMKKIGITEDLNEFKKLKEINLRLWDIEDDIRRKEAAKEFDEDFIKLARSVYFQNDRRAAVKREINLKFSSEFVEEKEYKNY